MVIDIKLIRNDETRQSVISSELARHRYTTSDQSVESFFFALVNVYTMIKNIIILDANWIKKQYQINQLKKQLNHFYNN